MSNSRNAGTGIVVLVYGQDTNPNPTDAIIQRIPYSGSVQSGSWATIGAITGSTPAGEVFIDYLPLTDTVYGYRAIATNDVRDDSDPIFEISGSAYELGDYDYTTRPWSKTDNPLELVMVPSMSNASYWHVTASVNAAIGNPAAGTPLIRVINSQNVGTITSSSVSASAFVIQRPISGSNSSVTFQNYLAGFRSATDLLELDALSDFNINDTIIVTATELRQFETGSIVAVSASNASGYAMSLAIAQAVSTSVSVLSPFAQSGTVGSALFSATRPNGATDATILFLATSSVARGQDSIRIERQDVSGSAYLRLDVTPFSGSATQVFYSASAYNPLNAPISFFASASTPNVTVVRTGPNTFTGNRPVSGSEGGIVFEVTSSQVNILPDKKTIIISKDPAGDTAALQLVLHLSESISSSIYVTGSFVDPKGLLNTGSATFTYSIEPANRFNVTDLGGLRYIIDRPPGNSEGGQFTLNVNAPGRIGASDTQYIEPQRNGLVDLTVAYRPLAISASYVTVTASAPDPLNQFPTTLNASVIGFPVGLSGTNGLYTVQRPPFGQISYLQIDATAFGRNPDSAIYEVPAMQGSQRSAAIPIGIAQELVDVGGSYSLVFSLSGFVSSSATGSQALNRGTQNAQSSSLSPITSYTPTVEISELKPGGITRYFQPAASSGSVPPYTSYTVGFTPDPNTNYSTVIKWAGDTWNNAAERTVAGIGGTSSGSNAEPFVVTATNQYSSTLTQNIELLIVDNASIDPTLKIQAYVRSGPVTRTLTNPTSAPAGATTTGTYVFSLPLSANPTTVEVFANMADGSTRAIRVFTLDAWFYPRFEQLDVTYLGNIATIYGRVDPVTVTGSNSLFWREYGSAPTFNSESIDLYRQFTFPVSMSATASRDIQIQMKNKDGAVPPTDYHIVVNKYEPRLEFLVSSSEGYSSGTLTVSVSDPLSIIHPTAKLKAYISSGSGAPILTNPTTAPGGTSGVYKWNVSLHPEYISKVEPFAYLTTGVTQSIGQWNFDSDKNANVLALNSAESGGLAFITAILDTDTRLGSGSLEYSYTGSAWQPLIVPSNLVVSWSVGQTNSGVQTLKARAYNGAGTIGPEKLIGIPPYTTPGTFNKAQINPTVSQSATQAVITYTSNGTVTYYKNGAIQNFGSAPASPLTVNRPTNGIADYYVYRCTVSGDVSEAGFSVDAIDLNTITPVVQLSPSTPTAASQSFTLTAFNPVGGAYVSADVYCSNTTGIVNGTNVSSGGSVNVATANGVTISFSRPAMGLPPGTIRIVSSISGGGTTETSRTISEQTQDWLPFFQPELELTTTTYTISWPTPPSGVTVTYRVNGVALDYSTSNPHGPYARPNVGDDPIALAFKATSSTGARTVPFQIPAQV